MIAPHLFFLGSFFSMYCNFVMPFSDQYTYQYFEPALLSRLSLARRHRPDLQPSMWSMAKSIVFAVWSIISVATADGVVTPRLLFADRPLHLVLLSARRVKMYGAELLRSIPHRPGAARRAVFARRLAAALILAALVRRPRLWKKKTEIKSKSVHCQRPCLIWPRWR